MSAAAPASAPRWLALALPLCLGAYGLAMALWPMWASGLSQMVVDPGDTRLINYVLEHDHRWLTGAAPSLWDQDFFFPERNVGAYTEINLAAAPFYSAFRLGGLPPDTAFQLWMASMLALNFAAAWLLFRRALAFEPVAAAVGAFLVAFGNARLTELNHQHLLPHFFTFLALYALVKAFTTPKPRPYLVAFFVALVLQLWANLTLGWFLGFALGLVFLWACVFGPTRERLRSVLLPHWATLLGLSICAALALLPLLLPFRRAAQSAGARDWGETALYLPQVQSWFYMGPHSWLMGWLAQLSLYTRLPYGGPRVGFGLVTTAIAAATLWRMRAHPWLKVLGLTAATLILLVSMYRGWVSPWQWVAAVVPGADGIRAVGRVALLLLVPAGIGVATYLEQARRRSLAWAVGALCMLEQGARVADSYDKAGMRQNVAQVAAAVPKGCRAFFYAPVGQPPYDPKTQLDAMWAQLATGTPTANGYSGHFPPEWDLLEHGVAQGGDTSALQAKLARWEERHALPHGSICFVAR